jgi:TRAP-type uncharacterized transport system substrate-binding protein
LRLVAAILLAFEATSAVAAGRIKLATGPERSAQTLMARDIARMIARTADLDVEVMPGAGPVESLQRLRDDAGVRLALLPADAAHAYLGAAAQGNPEANLLFAPVRVVAPLHAEDLYFIARSDAPISALHEIRDARINFGPLKSATALSATTLYRVLFGSPVADDKASFLPHEDALVKLITDQTIDVVAIVAEQPARLLADMKPEARRYVKLLRFDASQPGAEAVLRLYRTASLRAASYPNLLEQDLPGLSVQTYLVTGGQRGSDADAQIARLVRAWCQGLPRLKAEGHPQWREIGPLTPELGAGWYWARPAQRELRRCAEGEGAAAITESCSQQDRVLGLCD